MEAVPITRGWHLTAVVRNPLWATMRWAGRTLRSVTCQGRNSVSTVSIIWNLPSSCNLPTIWCT